MATTIGALPSNMIASLASLTFAGSAVAEPALQSTSTDWVEIVTAGAIALATGLSFLFWYAASKPNVIVKPSWRSGVATVVITNVGKALAKDLRVSAESLPLGPKAPTRHWTSVCQRCIPKKKLSISWQLVIMLSTMNRMSSTCHTDDGFFDGHEKHETSKSISNSTGTR